MYCKICIFIFCWFLEVVFFSDASAGRRRLACWCSLRSRKWRLATLLSWPYGPGGTGAGHHTGFLTKLVGSHFPLHVFYFRAAYSSISVCFSGGGSHFLDVVGVGVNSILIPDPDSSTPCHGPHLSCTHLASDSILWLHNLNLLACILVYWISLGSFTLWSLKNAQQSGQHLCI